MEKVKKSLSVMTPLVNVIENLRRIPPALSIDLSKGNSGRIGVLGGSSEYTGAPFFSAISSLKSGADLSFVFCHEEAATPIKSYSPEIMVIPVFRPSKHSSGVETLADMERVMTGMMHRLHTLVVGPGLGRDPDYLKGAKAVILKAKEANLGLVLDADGTFLLQQNLDLLQGYTNAIVTPNITEFIRLAAALSIDMHAADDLVAATEEMARKLGGPTIVLKGFHDIISNGAVTYVCGEVGSARRCGGQGDVLSGISATWLTWVVLLQKQLEQQQKHASLSAVAHPYIPQVPDAAFAACVLTKQCANQAFAKSRRATTASDLIAEIGTVSESLFPVADSK